MANDTHSFHDTVSMAQEQAQSMVPETLLAWRKTSPNSYEGRILSSNYLAFKIERTL